VRYRVTHSTTYAYASPVSMCHNEVRLTPRLTRGQVPLRTQLLVDPAPATLATHLDYFGNTVTFLTIPGTHDDLTITAMSDVDVTPLPTPTPETSPGWEQVRECLRAERKPETLDAYQFVFASPHVVADDAVAAYAEPSFPPERPLLAAVLDLTHRIHVDFAYEPDTTTVATSVAEVLAARRGVCQDFAHLAIACLRAQGLAARYVSGYLETLPAPGAERLRGQDASHAWIGVFCPDLGWIDIDPTNDQVVGGRHVTLAWGRDYGDVSPVKGVIVGGGVHTVDVAVDVEAG